MFLFFFFLHAENILLNSRSFFFFLQTLPLALERSPLLNQNKNRKQMPTLLLLPDLREPERHIHGETDLIRCARLLTAFR